MSLVYTKSDASRHLHVRFPYHPVPFAEERRITSSFTHIRVRKARKSWCFWRNSRSGTSCGLLLLFAFSEIAATDGRPDSTCCMPQKYDDGSKTGLDSDRLPHIPKAKALESGSKKKLRILKIWMSSRSGKCAVFVLYAASPLVL